MRTTTLSAKVIIQSVMSSELVGVCSKLQKVLFNPDALKWMSLEWSSDECDHGFFDKTDTFEQWLAVHFPKLKTRRMTRAEWRRIKKYASAHHRRLFSPKYLHEKRRELHLFRNGMTPSENDFDVPCASDTNANAVICTISSYADSQSIDEVMQDCEIASTSHQSNFEDDSDTDLFRLLVDTSNCLSKKAILLDQLKEFMNSSPGGIAADDAAGEIGVGGKLIMELYNLNTEILANFESLWNFHQVKVTLLFSSTTRVKADYFRQKCQLAIIEKFRQLQAESIQQYTILSPVVESLLTLTYMLKDCESHSRETFTELLTEEIKKLKLLCGEENAVFEQQWLPQLMELFTKSTGTNEDEDKYIMQYIS